MNVFELRNRLIADYGRYVRSFIRIQDDKIRERVDNELGEGLLWPEPLIQLNPSFEPGEWIDELVESHVLHEECRRVFRIKIDPKEEGFPVASVPSTIPIAIVWRSRYATSAVALRPKNCEFSGVFSAPPSRPPR